MSSWHARRIVSRRPRGTQSRWTLFCPTNVRRCSNLLASLKFPRRPLRSSSSLMIRPHPASDSCSDLRDYGTWDDIWNYGTTGSSVISQTVSITSSSPYSSQPFFFRNGVVTLGGWEQPACEGDRSLPVITPLNQSRPDAIVACVWVDLEFFVEVRVR